MSGEDKRRSERAVPVVSDEDVAVIQVGPGKTILTKMLDLSEGGTLVYMLADGDPGNVGAKCSLSMYHDRKIFDVPTTIVRKDGRLVAFQFANVDADSMRDIQAKLIRMEIEWMRLSRRG